MPGPTNAVQSAFQESEDSKQKAKDYFMARFAGVGGRIEDKKSEMRKDALKKFKDKKFRKNHQRYKGYDATLSDEENVEKMLREATHIGNAVDYWYKKAKQNSKEISLSGQMRMADKTEGIGRYVKEKSGIRRFFSAIFNPIRNLFSKKKRPVEKPEYNLENGYFNPFASMTNGADEEQNSLMSEFGQEVAEQTKLEQKHDYGAENYDDESRDWQVLDYIQNNRLEEVPTDEKEAKKQAKAQRHQDISSLASDAEKYAEKYAQNYDAMKEFQPDFKAEKQEKPDNFEVVIAVEPPNEIYGAYSNQLNTEKNSARKKIKNWFGERKKLGDTKRVLEEQMKTSSYYQELCARGEAEAKQAGMKYDPKNDPNIDILRGQLAQGIAEKQGHTFVRLVAKRGKKPMHGYSFGFWPLTSTYGMGGIVNGVVKNPDPEANSDELMERRHEVDYSGYMKAAAKVRGVVGSQRSYSFLGYNCTSFAADVAKEAGVPIKAEDTSDIVRTYHYHGERIDSPYAIVKYVKAGMYDPKDPKMKEQATAVWQDMDFREQMDKETLQSFKKVVDGMDTKLTMKNDFEKEKYKERKQYLGLENKWMNLLLTNPVFELLYTTYAQDAKEDNNSNSNVKKVLYAKQLIRSILGKTTELVEKFDGEMEDEKKEFLSKEKDEYEGDPLSEARRFVLGNRRRKMQETFGTATGVEFITHACENAEGLSRAFTLLSTVKTENGDVLNFNNAKQAVVSKNGKTDRQIEREKNVNKDELRNQRLADLAKNPYYLEHIAGLKDEVYGSQRGSMAERMLKCIEAMAKQYSPYLLGDQWKVLEESPDVVKVQMMAKKQTESKHKLGTLYPEEFIDRVCKDPVEMKRAFDNGMQQPVILQKMEQNEGVEAIRKKAVFDGEQKGAIQNYTVECFDKYVLEPWFQAVEKMQTLCDGSVDVFKSFFFRNDEKILAFVVEYANRSWPVREKLEYFLRGNAGKKDKQEDRAAYMKKFLKQVFEEIEPVDKENVDDSGSGQETKELEVIKACCKAVGLYNEEQQRAAVQKRMEMIRARKGA